MLWKSSRRRPENLLETPRINLQPTLERQIRTSPGRHLRTSLGRQILTSQGWLNRICRNVLGMLQGDVLRTNISKLGSSLELFGSWFYHRIYDRINYLICKKGNYKDGINRNFARIRIDSHNSLPLEKILTFHNVIILIKSVEK